MFQRRLSCALLFGASLLAACSSKDGGSADADAGQSCTTEVIYCFPLSTTAGGVCGAMATGGCGACPAGYSFTNQCPQDSGAPDGDVCNTVLTCFPIAGSDAGGCGPAILSKACQQCPEGYSSTNECAEDAAAPDGGIG